MTIQNTRIQCCNNKAHLARFIHSRLHHNTRNSKQPHTDHIAYMSPYLHFGQIFPLYAALDILQARNVAQSAKDALTPESVMLMNR